MKLHRERESERHKRDDWMGFNGEGEGFRHPLQGFSRTVRGIWMNNDKHAMRYSAKPTFCKQTCGIDDKGRWNGHT